MRAFREDLLELAMSSSTSYNPWQPKRSSLQFIYRYSFLIKAGVDYNNTTCSTNVDKFDYLQRDAKHIGLDYTFNPNRIFNKSFVSPDTNSIVYDKNRINIFN